MCFTVAIVRKGELMTAQEYYSDLPVVRKSGESIPELPYHYLVSGFSHPRLAIVKQDNVSLFEWGLIPSWVKDQKAADELRSKTLNAVGETLFEKPSFRNSITSKRCLLPVSGFYEWREVNGVKYPYYIQLKEQDYFSLGSIYDTWINKDTGEIRNTFSIITTPANPFMEQIHNLKKRMPLILAPEDHQKWLVPDLKTEHIKELIKPFPETQMKAYTISRDAGNARNNRDVPGIMERVDYTELQQI
jgi:putative SOS response-associated peptidase YedK